MDENSELVSKLREFIAFRTVSDNHHEVSRCLDWVEHNWLRAAGIPLHQGWVNGAEYRLLKHSDPQLLWVAHVDVMPGRDDQFQLELRNGRAYGRGTKDMKGGALPFLMAYREACSHAAPPVSILLTSDEEIAGLTVAELVEQGEVSAPLAFIPDTGAKDQIVVQQKGFAWATITATGQGAHGSAPWSGLNPVETIAKVVLDLIAAFPAGSGDDWHITVTPTQLSGSATVNSIPNSASCGIDIRHLPTMDQATAVGLIEARLPGNCKLDIINSGAPLNTARDLPMVDFLRENLRRIRRSNIEVGGEHGTSDARFLARHGIPTVLLGPVGDGHHGPHEWISLESLDHHLQLNRAILGMWS